MSRLFLTLLFSISILITISTVAKLQPLETMVQYSHSLFEDLSFSPDGTLLAVADMDRILLWDLKTGRVLKRLEENESNYTVTDCGFWPGSRLLVVMNKGRGEHFAFFDAETGANVGAPPNFSWERVHSVDVSPNGLVQALPEGEAINLVDTRNGELITIIGGSTRPTHRIVLSPTRDELAIAHSDSLITLWNVRGATELKTLRGHREWVSRVYFNADGTQLVSIGSSNSAILWDTKSGKAIYSWPLHEGIPVSAVSSADNTLALGAGANKPLRLFNLDSPAKEPFVTVPLSVSDDWYKLAFNSDGSRLASTISSEGYFLAFDTQTWESSWAFLEFSYASDVNFNPSRPNEAVIVGNSGIAIVDFSDMSVSRLSSNEIYDSVHLMSAFNSDASVLAVALDNHIRLYNYTDRVEINRIEFDQGLAFNNLQFAADDQHLFSAGKFGHAYLWDTKNYRKAAELYLFDERNWAVVTAESVFDVSPDAEKFIHFVKGTEVIELHQLKQRYYEPQLLSKLLGFNPEPVRGAPDPNNLSLYPDVELNDPTADNPNLNIKLTNRGGGIGKVVVFINGKEIASDARGPSVNPTAAEANLDINIENHPYLIPGEDNVIEVKAYNGEGFLSSRGGRKIYKAPEVSSDPPSFWAVVAGVSDYKGREIDLRYAGKDAVDMAKALKLGAERLFPGRNHVELLTTDADATQTTHYPSKENLKKIIMDIAGKAKSGDVLIIYLAGHGITHGGAEGDYYYLTAEAMDAELKDSVVREAVGVSSDELTEWIKQVPALKQVLILDTCHSGRFTESMTSERNISSSQIRSYERMKDRIGLHILAGSAADAVAYEASSFGQGLLTYSLLLGMQSEGLREGAFVDISRLFEFAADRVPVLAEGIGGIQKPIVTTPKGGNSFDIGELSFEDRQKIPVAVKRPMIEQVNFQNDSPPFRDDLKMAVSVNNRLRELSSRGQHATIVFVDAIEVPNAYKLSGRYKVSGDQLTITGYIYRGDETPEEFTVTGAASHADNVIAELVTEAEKILRNAPK